MFASAESHRLRLAVVGVVIVSIFATLVARLWYLQFLAAPNLRPAVEANRTREIVEPAPRGRLIDRNGQVLADNRLSLIVVADPEQLEAGDSDATLARLATLVSTPGLRLTVPELKSRMEDPRAVPYGPRTLATDVSKDVAIEIREHPELFPGIGVETRLLRSYVNGPAGALAPHLIGYLGEASPDDLKADPTLEPGDIVGRGGIEEQYQKLLRGENGIRRIEVDARGRLIGGQLSYTPPSRGYDLELSIDADIQRMTEISLAEGVETVRGIWDDNQLKRFLANGAAAVVLDAQTGEVVAEASFPGFDLNAFTTGDDARVRQYLDPKNRGFPLNDRAIGGLYPPGSTFKPVVASMALEMSATATSGEFGSFPCGGSYIIPGDTSQLEFNDWIPERYGFLDLANSVIRSCDIAFYIMGVRMENRFPGGGAVATMARAFGYGTVTGIDLPNEAEGRMPDEQWKRDYHRDDPENPNADWFTGDAVNVSIGQGDVIATPLQMAVAYAAIINGGKVYRPHVLRSVSDPSTGEVVQRVEPEIRRTLPIKSEHLRFVTEAMTGVVRGEGTGAAAFSGFPIDRYYVGGKTGTSETAGGAKQDTAWFVGFVGRGQPQYVVSVVVEEGGHGGSGAAPIARRIMEGLMGEAAERIVVSVDSGDR